MSTAFNQLTKERLSQLESGLRIKDNILIPNNSIKKTPLEATKLADHLADKLNSPGYRKFFMKAYWRLDRGTIDRYAGAALELADCPRAYFISLCKNDDRYKK